MAEIIEKISKTPIRKSTPIESLDRFEKGEKENLVLEMSNKAHRKLLSDKLEDLSGYNTKHLSGGKYNESLLKASSDIEMIGAFSDPAIKTWLKDIHKIEVVSKKEA